MLITFFDAQEMGKMPISKNNIFQFKQKDINLKDVYKINKNYWLLNGNFKFPNSKFEGKRNKVHLKQYLTENFNFLIIDLDDVKTKLNLQNIIEILKNENFHFALWSSTSFNGKDNFNLKGIIEFEGKNNDTSLQKAINYLQSLLKGYCKVDPSSVRIAGVQKPTHKENLIFYNKGNNIPQFFFEDKKIELNSISNNSFLNLCLKTYEKLGFYICKENNEIINLGHPKEKTKCGYFIYKNNPQICYHFNKTKLFTIFDYIKNDPVFKKYNQEKFLQEFEKKIYFPIKNKITFNHRYINVEKLDLGDIAYNEVIYVKSPMGTGKTNIIKKLEKNKKTLIITNRITLAQEYKEKFPHFKLYNQDLYFKGDSLIVQYESLYKYDLKHFDLFIIDEFMSLIDHSLSGLGEYKDINNLKLFYILKKFKQPLLLMDAFLTGFETKFVERKKYRYYENLYKDDNNLYLYKNVNCFIKSIKETLEKNNKKVTLSTTNKSFAKIIHRLFKDKYKVALITSDTDNKQFFTQHFNKDYHNEWDLLIYTPTITTGVNILNMSDHHFHYSDGTGSVISSLQQIKRNRKAKNIHFFLKGKRFNRITNLEELETDINKKLVEFAVKNSFFVEFDEFANPKLNEMGKWQLHKVYLHNLLNTNPLHSFNIFLKEQFKGTFNEIEECQNVDFNIKEINKKIKDEERKKYLDKVTEILETDMIEFQLKYETDFKELKEKFEKYFTNLSINDIKDLIKICSSDKKFLKEINNLILFQRSIEDLKNMIGVSMIENLDKKLIRNLELIYEYKKNGILLKNKYTLIDVKDQKFKNFIRLLGYRRKNNVYELKNTIVKYLNKIKI